MRNRSYAQIFNTTNITAIYTVIKVDQRLLVVLASEMGSDSL